MNFCEGITLVFVVLKLLGLINWSWWLVFAPIWIPVVLFMVCASIVVLCDELQKKEKK